MKLLLIYFMGSILNFTTGEWKQLKTEEAVLIEYKLYEHHDDKNDIHIEYVIYRMTNLTNEDVEVDFVHKYSLNGKSLKTSKDRTTRVQIPANGSVEGNVTDQKNLILFKRYLPGNSGKLASDNVYEDHSIAIVEKR